MLEGRGVHALVAERVDLRSGRVQDMADDQVFVQINPDVACHVIYSVRARTRDLSVVKLQFSGASDRLEWPARPYEVQAEWRNEGLTGTYLFELEAHPG